MAGVFTKEHDSGTGELTVLDQAELLEELLQGKLADFGHAPGCGGVFKKALHTCGVDVVKRGFGLGHGIPGEACLVEQKFVERDPGQLDFGATTAVIVAPAQ